MVCVLAGTDPTVLSERALAEYAAALQAGRKNRQLDVGLWLTPTKRSQRELTRQLVQRLDGACWTPRFETFDSFAEWLLRRAGRPATPISSTVQRLLLRRITQQFSTAGELPHFAPVAQTAGFLDVVESFISELKRDEIWPEHFLQACAGASDTAQRDRELGQIYQRYQDALQNHKWYDAEGRFWLARNELASGNCDPLPPWQYIAVVGFADFTRTQHEILEHLARHTAQLVFTLPWDESRPEVFAKSLATGERLRRTFSNLRWENAEPKPGFSESRASRSEAASNTSEVFRDFGSLFPEMETPPSASRKTRGSSAAGKKTGRRSQTAEVSEDFGSRVSVTEKVSRTLGSVRDIEPPFRAVVREGLFVNPRGWTPSPSADGLELIATTGPQSEQTTVARRIKRLLAEGVAPGTIAVGLRSLTTDGLAWTNALVEAGLPVWCEVGSPVREQGLVKFLVAVLQAELEDWAFPRLMTVLDSSFFQPHLRGVEVSLAARAVSASLRRLQLPEQRHVILETLERIAARSERSLPKNQEVRRATARNGRAAGAAFAPLVRHGDRAVATGAHARRLD